MLHAGDDFAQNFVRSQKHWTILISWMHSTELPHAQPSTLPTHAANLTVYVPKVPPAPLHAFPNEIKAPTPTDAGGREGDRVCLG